MILENSSFANGELMRDVVGDSLVVSACFISCIGVNLQKLAHTHNEGLPAEKRKTMLWSVRWWAGILLMIAASVMDLAALPLIPLSRLAALGSTTLVANVLVTPWFQNEILTLHDIAGCAITLLGSSTACYYGSYKQPDLTYGLLLELVYNPSLVAYAIGVGSVLLVSLIYIENFRRKECELRKEGVLGGEQPEYLECFWAFDNLSTVASPNSSVEFVTKFGPQFYPTVHASFAGVLGGHSIMFAKAAISILFTLTHAFTPATGCAFTVCALFAVLSVWGQIYYLNKALRMYKNVLYVLPIYQSLWVVSGVASGLIFYKEYTRLPPHDLSLFLLGVVITLLGLLVLSRGTQTILLKGKNKGWSSPKK
eukprot:TRINITY_DN2713_c0_g5_i1.p1 TRINITY_DN2713_c0_g5~~TRINITY_DN2713_c0_g5_i1.p1  ORF type:complete len:367 (+),score=6.10 TRINITY_DN2713_c0_g5_i1:60-1160(+)